METITDPIRNFERFVAAHQRRGKSAIQIRDDIMSRGYDLHSAADAVATYWSDTIAQEEDDDAENDK